jgi:F-type H+-transporting ATPase subunit gamma
MAGTVKWNITVVSSRSENMHRLDLYRELDDIVSAMKNLAQVELHRISRAEPGQLAATQICQQALQALPESAHVFTSTDVYILLGSERGFCGGLNEQLIRELPAAAAGRSVILVGARLSSKLDTPRGDVTHISAPATGDEVLTCARQLLTCLQPHIPCRINLLQHRGHGVEPLTLWPLPPAVVSTVQPRTYMPVAQLAAELQAHYLLHSLAHALLVSLKTENRQRLQQMDAARDHLQNLSQQLLLRMNVLRQQEIVDEIEVILAGQETAD